MRYFDLHCDTVSRAYKENKSLYDGDTAVTAMKGRNIEKWEQCFALWLSDELKGEAAFSLCESMLWFYRRRISELNEKGITNITPHLTIENASALGGDLIKIEHFKRHGVKMISLTWNGENDIASGVDGEGGLKKFGIEAVREMERCGIIVDVSHLNEEGFRDVCKVARKPFIASHSNCYDICPHKRNLKRWQIKEIADRGGFIGINFYPAFLGKGSVFKKIRENIEYLLSLGGENIIAVGSDFDGADMSPELQTAEDVVRLRGYLLSWGMSNRVVEKVFYENAQRMMDLI